MFQFRVLLQEKLVKVPVRGQEILFAGLDIHLENAVIGWGNFLLGPIERGIQEWRPPGAGMCFPAFWGLFWREACRLGMRPA